MPPAALARGDARAAARRSCAASIAVLRRVKRGRRLGPVHALPGPPRTQATGPWGPKAVLRQDGEATWRSWTPGLAPCQSGPIIAYCLAHSCAAATQSAHPSPCRRQPAQKLNPKAQHAGPEQGCSGRPAGCLPRARHAQRGGAQRCSSLGRRPGAPRPCPGGMQQAGSRWCALGAPLAACCCRRRCRRCRLAACAPPENRLLCALMCAAIPLDSCLQASRSGQARQQQRRRGSSQPASAKALRQRPCSHWPLPSRHRSSSRASCGS